MLSKASIDARDRLEQVPEPVKILFFPEALDLSAFLALARPNKNTRLSALIDDRSNVELQGKMTRASQYVFGRHRTPSLIAAFLGGSQANMVAKQIEERSTCIDAELVGGCVNLHRYHYFTIARSQCRRLAVAATMETASRLR